MDFNEISALIKQYLPKHLSPQAQEDLFHLLKTEPFNTTPTSAETIYVELPDKNLWYQGDGVKDVAFSLFSEQLNNFETFYYPAAILSNTCDIDPSNERATSPNPRPVFGAIFTVADYLYDIRLKGIDEGRIQSFLAALKSNTISNLFYLPKFEAGGIEILPESFIQFDLAISHPNSFMSRYSYDYSPMGDRLFSLSMYGFYFFLLKLSIHFTRIREGVFR